MSWTVGPFDVADADEVGRVHVKVWQEAYAGLMPAAYLDGLDPVSFAEVWRTRDSPREGVGHWVARDADGVVGLASSGPARDDGPPTALELYAINVLRRAHGTGLADDLLAHAIGDRAAYLWVADGNDRAVAFYRRHRFADEGGRKAEPDTGVLELRLARGPVGEPA
jgi:ribosomal protein S18 acetylase RimI-like enzyme